MKLPRSRQSRRGRIEIIPMIDVMFFLLATFMLASLSLQNLHSLPVNLPEGKTSTAQPRAPVTLTVTKNDHIYLDKREVTLTELTPTLKTMLKGGKSVIVAADRASRNGVLVEAMLAARQAGVQHFLIAVRQP
ncbi:ExbD/TolR family protein [Acidihalobacter ferrooxydans]|uniref:Biopolymer transporter ExbD n=1 Tax=Acidihalobacter ferrooxydans TaxID=1765967 RepID=A0A1P8UDT0_9GAMM|nr:biopolymer transporter ExbD [Acidihalobacter ferrooxydans]APZ42021.1 biopolymer transporter ExbD [Acidihalobacter ferrooxydans]